MFRAASKARNRASPLLLKNRLYEGRYSPRYLTQSSRFSSSGLLMPTHTDADELFQRMNARPESILVAKNGPSKVAKYNQDWTVRVSIFPHFTYTMIGSHILVFHPSGLRSETISRPIFYCCSSQDNGGGFQSPSILS